jgi:NAD(P)-dependent dehydrogenase (short-subunit alcohol dehydrogenase family)
MGLENKVAVIAGATGGLGRVVTQKLAAQGMRVALLGSDVDRLNALVTELNLSEGTFSTHALQVEDRDAVFETARAVMEKFGQVDALLNFVGGWLGGKTVVEIEAQGLTDMLNQHVWTTFHLMQAFVPHMLENKWGRLATVSAPNSLFPQPKRAAYAAAKAAQEAFMLGLAQEVKGTGVTSNVLVVQAIDAKHERDTAPSEKNALWTTPEEISAALLYLLSDEAHVVNGQRIVMYGG